MSFRLDKKPKYFIRIPLRNACMTYVGRPCLFGISSSRPMSIRMCNKISGRMSVEKFNIFHNMKSSTEKYHLCRTHHDKMVNSLDDCQCLCWLSWLLWVYNICSISMIHPSLCAQDYMNVDFNATVDGTFSVRSIFRIVALEFGWVVFCVALVYF